MKWSVLIVLVMAIIALFIVGCSPSDSTKSSDSHIKPSNENPIDDSGDEFLEQNSNPQKSNQAELVLEENEEIKTLEDGTKYLIDPNKIIGGGPKKDGIPSIDNPKFISVEEADEWIQDDELVLAIDHNNVKRVYPLQIMVWHEIVNDIVGGDPLAVTYCPLCMTGIAYHRVIDGEVVEFGTSGKLYNSNLVMYDRKTDSYWTQVWGRAVVGELTGMQLKAVGIDTVEWGTWKKNHPDSEVLSKDTGIDRPYGQDPYGNYYSSTSVLFPVENENNVIHPKTMIHGIRVGDQVKAYKDVDLKKLKRIEDEFAGITVIAQIDNAGVVTFTNKKTSEEIVKESGFWFSWYAFHPDTEVYEIKKE